MKTKVVIDGRQMTREQVVQEAMRKLGVPEVEEDVFSNGDHGFFLTGNALCKYHVPSVMQGMYVISRTPLVPEQTRAMVKSYIKRHNI